MSNNVPTLGSIKHLDPESTQVFAGAAITHKSDGSQCSIYYPSDGEAVVYCRETPKTATDPLFGTLVAHVLEHVVPRLERGYIYHCEMIKPGRPNVISYTYAFKHNLVLFAVQRLEGGLWATPSVVAEVATRASMDRTEVFAELSGPCTAADVAPVMAKIESGEIGSRFGPNIEGVVVYFYNDAPVDGWAITSRRKVVRAAYAEFRASEKVDAYANILDFARSIGTRFTEEWLKHVVSHLTNRGEVVTLGAIVRELERDIDDFRDDISRTILLYVRDTWRNKRRGTIVAHARYPDNPKKRRTMFVSASMFEVAPGPRAKDGGFVQNPSIRTITLSGAAAEAEFVEATKEIAAFAAELFSYDMNTLRVDPNIPPSREQHAAAEKVVDAAADEVFSMDNARRLYAYMRPHILAVAEANALKNVVRMYPDMCTVVVR